MFTAPPPPPAENQAQAAEVDNDILCPICMQVIKDAFLTCCGHSFCYVCISVHLRNKNDCPSCSHFLTADLIFPNFLLDKILRKNSGPQKSRPTSPFEHFHQALKQGGEVSLRELDSLMSLLAEKKKKIEKENAETNLRLLLDLLHCLRKKKLKELNEVQADLQYIKEDIVAVERHKNDSCIAKERQLDKFKNFSDDYSQMKARHVWSCRHGSGNISGTHGLQDFVVNGSLLSTRADETSQIIYQESHGNDANSGGSDTETAALCGLAARKKRLYSQFEELQEYYLQNRRHWARRQSQKKEARDEVSVYRESYNPSLEDFKMVLSAFTRFSRQRVVAELRHANIFRSANIVSSIEFDRDDEYFATAGVSRCIKVFEFSSVVNEPSDVHCPIMEISTRSNLCCLSWNKSKKHHIASSDYEGMVTIWDVNTRQSVMEYEEHERRAWSVDFSRTDPSLLVSGSDDCKVKIWCSKQEASALNIDMKANICSVKFNPGSSMYIAVGSADHHIYYYDLRNTNQPLHVLSGHLKAVSYVSFVSNNELASASTDTTLRLWDIKKNLPLRIFKGHTNEKNFVGLSVIGDYIACGSETNEVFVYHKAISKPMTWHKFTSLEIDGVDDNTGSCFTSAVCWKSDNLTLLSANSIGTIRVLELAP